MEALMSSARPKLHGYDFYRKVLGSPQYVVAPMVDQSELVRDLKPNQHDDTYPSVVGMADIFQAIWCSGESVHPYRQLVDLTVLSS